MSKAGPVVELMKWIGAGVAMIAITLVISLVWLRGVDMKSVGIGWVVAIINGFAATAVNRRALCKGKITFVLWGLAGNLVRFIVLVAVVGAVYVSRVADIIPFLLAFLIGYFAFLSREISELVTLTSGERRGDD